MSSIHPTKRDLCEGSLSPAELERLRQYSPTIAAHVDAKAPLPPLLESVIEAWRQAGCPAVAATQSRPAPVSIESIACEQAEELRGEVRRLAAADPARAQAEKPALPDARKTPVWCGYPTTIARVSPFFPMNNLEKGRRDMLVRDLRTPEQDRSRLVSAAFFFNEPVSSGPWGTIRYTGPKLSIEEEDTLMALLAIIEAGPEAAASLRGGKKKRPPKPEPEGEDGMVPMLPDAPVAHYAIEGAQAFPDRIRSLMPETTPAFMYRGPLMPILRLMGHKRPGANHYNKVLTSLKCLALGSMELTVTENGEDVQYDRSPILSNLRLRLREHEVSVTVNPFFYHMYLANRLTWIDVAKRFQIRGSIAKALYRFCQSHRENPVFRGDIRKLTQAVNMDPRAPLKESRRQIRDAIAELVEKKVLERSSILTNGNVVILNRTGEALPKRRRVPRAS